MRIEGISTEVAEYCKGRHLKLASDSRAKATRALLARAISTITQSQPLLGKAVAELVWSCHIVLAEDDDYDISYTDPIIPFSIFVSVPERQDQQSMLRVAENVIHETMHLQLTLFEGLCPLIDIRNDRLMYSPWKQSERPAQGVLHGLYVFTVLRWFWQNFAKDVVDPAEEKFACRRVVEITDEVRLVHQLTDSPALTEAGTQLLSRLLAL